MNLDFITFREFFNKFGVMEDCVILKDKHTRKPRGFGFVTYLKHESAAKVMEHRKEHYINGKWIDCKSAIPASEIQNTQRRNHQ